MTKKHNLTRKWPPEHKKVFKILLLLVAVFGCLYVVSLLLLNYYLLSEVFMITMVFSPGLGAISAIASINFLPLPRKIRIAYYIVAVPALVVVVAFTLYIGSYAVYAVMNN